MVEQKKEKVEWQKCPKCSGFIPKSWARHEKCGWNIPDDEQSEVEKLNEIRKELSQAKIAEPDEPMITHVVKNDERQGMMDDLLDIHTKLKEALEKKWNIAIKEHPEVLAAVNCEFIEMMRRLQAYR